MWGAMSMKYSETLEVINEVVKLMQDDIYENPCKYLKGDKIDIDNISLKVINNIKKHLTPSWIDESDFHLLSQDKHIKLITDKKKKSIVYKLVDNNGHECILSNEIATYYKYDNDNLILYIIFPIKGEYLEFNYILDNIINYQVINIDLSVLATYLAMCNKKAVNNRYLKLNRK